MKNVRFELTDAEYQVASTLKSYVGKQWKQFFMHLVDKVIEIEKLDEEPAFKKLQKKDRE